ncbi:antitoxin [Bifidobacterium sp. 82T10]|uniref:Antitoxin n=1 Tax=Bifidobacterium miconis TaxID=2834435 RepID=A0ABS6WC75_9BIFI|nr:antitoxin [Bifidobacterium miconis]
MRCQFDVNSITSGQLEGWFDDGEDIFDFLDLDNPVIEHHSPLGERVVLTMPAWMVDALDKEAENLAVSRNAVVNTWIADQLRSMR